MTDESAKHFVHRLEGFSDIVIGFSLAQLGASLVIPARTMDLVEHPGWLVGFLFAFAVVCSMWFFHHRRFSRFFVPKTLPIILNFIWLAVVVLLVYTTELYVRTFHDIVATRMYFCAYTFAYGILGVQYLIANTKESLRASIFMFLWTAPFLICLLATLFLSPDVVNVVTSFAFTGTALAFIFLARRFPREPAANRP
ncbi:MAG TPA: TMEM175 family protein [Candidatus Acidoferrales bacterium]|nr:TMEM175 family protein [Candidatus Acidoferrales bacterium]